MRKLYTLEDLRARKVLYSTSQLHRLEKAGKFPRRVQIGGGQKPLWDAEEIELHIERAIAARATYATRVLVPDTAA